MLLVVTIAIVQLFCLRMDPGIGQIKIYQQPDFYSSLNLGINFSKNAKS